MLRTRLWMGSILILLAIGVLVIDQWLWPWCPFLFVLVLGLSLVASYELLTLLGPTRPLPAWFCYVAVALVVIANWGAQVPLLRELGPDPWRWIMGTFTAVVLSTFVLEMAVFKEPGESVMRIALVIWIVAYLGLLPCFLAQQRWLSGGRERETVALAMTIFVPKCCDIGAYFTGRFLGRHKMTPTLSPKKTWEGLAGGLTAAVATTAGIQYLGPTPALSGVLAVIGFGITVGGAGVLGDLAESLIKRDCQKKDASQAVPGFGGVLDVVDSILFGAPVAYCWLS